MVEEDDGSLVTARNEEEKEAIRKACPWAVSKSERV